LIMRKRMGPVSVAVMVNPDSKYARFCPRFRTKVKKFKDNDARTKRTKTHV
jgi:hypothetical protein